MEFVGHWEPAAFLAVKHAIGNVEVTRRPAPQHLSWLAAPWVVIHEEVGGKHFYFAHRVGIDQVFRGRSVNALCDRLAAFAEERDEA